MSIEQNKAVVTDLFARFTASDVEGVLNLLTDDAIWWIAGKAGTAPIVGNQSKEQMGRLFHRMLSQMTDGMKMTVKAMTAEGDRVAAEVESYAPLKNGRLYNQEYHLLIQLRDGRICAVREYLDTQHVQAVWFQA
jgi:ketosteroid isomerase-like protein